MGSGEWVAVAYLAYMGEPPLVPSIAAGDISLRGPDAGKVDGEPY